jgi:hypothetical protein
VDAQTVSVSTGTYITGSGATSVTHQIVTPADDFRAHRGDNAKYIVRLTAQNERLAVSKLRLDAQIAKNAATVADLTSKNVSFAAAIRTLEGPDAPIDFVDPVTPVDPVVGTGETYTPYESGGP